MSHPDLGEGTMVTAAAMMLWAILCLAPQTPIGRALHRWTVAAPAARLNRITRGQVLLAMLLVSGASLVGWLIGHEAVRLIAMGLPDLAGIVATFEVTAYLDALAAIVTAASAARFGAVRTWLATVFRPRRATSRTPRTASRPVSKATANDDEDRRYALAA
ncbi:hypothetical protein M9980_00155 [Sphingomonas donggukensis]|uniref:Uncharacterized protein n=1 Tax=Sphingomonas donggukensis TaxID=2949093 RepID=A0ABY4TW12_9SPHN|nr:hypothetical protein [Sphingomonas donggukensis]URW75687.1 hypothetical protein M9980_00155 [Sphingomonas donggukensis]